jgi:hypothetical protein
MLETCIECSYMNCIQVRADSAEYLYLFLQGTDAIVIEEEAEEILLETEW